LFAILQISDSNTIFRKPQIQSQRINLPSGDAFFIVTADKHLGKIPWNKLEKCLGILKHNILLPDNITVPEGINITKFSSDILPRLILMNSATDYITNHRFHFQNKSLTIFDEKAIYQSYIEKLLPYFCSIRIIIDLPEKYNFLSRNLLENYGFSLIISTEESFNSDVIISHNCKAPIYFDGTLFSDEGNRLMNGRVFTGSEITLPELYERLRPENIGDILFASALYESCNEKALGKLRYKNFGS
jgi:hypothetical protein